MRTYTIIPLALPVWMIVPPEQTEMFQDYACVISLFMSIPPGAAKHVHCGRSRFSAKRIANPRLRLPNVPSNVPISGLVRNDNCNNTTFKQIDLLMNGYILCCSDLQINISDANKQILIAKHKKLIDIHINHTCGRNNCYSSKFKKMICIKCIHLLMKHLRQYCYCLKDLT